MREPNVGFGESAREMTLSEWVQCLPIGHRARAEYTALTAPAVHEDTRFLKLLGEIDCRIEHGAQSNGHLEGLRSIYDPRYAARATPEGK